MAGVSPNQPSLFGPRARAQYGAVAQMRWQMQLNSLRSKRGKFELAARTFATGFFSLIWLGLGIGFGTAAYQLTIQGQLHELSILFWAVLAIWQMFPLVMASAQQSIELGFLLRFPVSFASYVLLYLCLGIFDLAALFGGISILGIWIGIVAARPALAGWAVVALAIFAVFNLLLTRMIFAWIDRWLAQRRTREILGVIFLIFFVGLQLVNPALHRQMSSMSQIRFAHIMRVADAAQGLLPPGLAAGSIERAGAGRTAEAVATLGGVALCAIGAGLLLSRRLRAEYRGENLGETANPTSADVRASHAAASHRPAPRVEVSSAATQRLWLDGPIWAVFAKELCYLSRSGVMLFGLFAPLILIFAMGGPMRADQTIRLEYAFPIAIAYGFLPLTRQVCNSLGTEGAGIQIYFLSPTPFRTVMLAKNLLQTGLFCLELLLVGCISIYRFGMPNSHVALATACWLLFALPANLAAGNVLSITMAYRMTLTRLSREQGSVGNGLLSLVIQLLIFVIGAAIYLWFGATGHRGWVAPVYLLLALGSFALWLRGLGNVDEMANRRRESLMETLVRPA